MKIRKVLDQKKLEVSYLQTDKQIGDIMTKSLNLERFAKHRLSIGLIESSTMFQSTDYGEVLESDNQIDFIIYFPQKVKSISLYDQILNRNDE